MDSRLVTHLVEYHKTSSNVQLGEVSYTSHICEDVPMEERNADLQLGALTAG